MKNLNVERMNTQSEIGIAAQVSNVSNEDVAVIKEFQALSNALRLDYLTEEAIKEREEVKASLLEDPTMDKLHEQSPIVAAGQVGLICEYYRGWLITYKGRGYIILDVCNGYYEYICTAEELIESMAKKLTEV